MRNRLRLWGAILVLAAVAAVAPAGAQERIQGDVYTNSRHGIEISKPSSWHFITAGMIVELAKRSAGQTSIRGDEDPVKLTGMAVIVSKTPSLGLEISPHVILRVFELKERPSDLAKTCEGLRAGMSEPETVQPTREVRLGDLSAVRLDFRGYVDGTLIRAAALCLARERQAYVVVGQALATDFDAEARVFDTILGSFKLK